MRATSQNRAQNAARPATTVPNCRSATQKMRQLPVTAAASNATHTTMPVRVRTRINQEGTRP
jgi:hypothetical protein